ncbi:MAG: thiamine phosphate synthase [Chloroflexota bacterium]
MSLPSRLLLITDRLSTQHALQVAVARVLDAGCRWILVREKDLPGGRLLLLVQEIVALAKPYGAAVSVSANLMVAAACPVQGIHLPWGVSPHLARHVVARSVLVGVSAHSPAEAQQAAAGGADYVSLSPTFLTQSKPGYGPALGLAGLTHVVATLPVPIFALGGVTPENAAACLQAGAFGVAVMGAVMRAAMPGRVVRDILQALDTQLGGLH